MNLISLSEVYVESIVASTLIGTMPLFTYIIAFFISENKRQIRSDNIKSLVCRFEKGWARGVTKNN